MSIVIRMNSLRSQMESLGERATAAARPASQAAAQVLYDETLKNVSQIKARTGKLRSSIYQAFAERDSEPGLAVYNVSWNPRKARHGLLVEFGHLQRYEYYKDESGNVRPKVRPEMMGKPRPISTGRNRAALDAYYVTLPTPVQVPAQSFLRKAMSAQPRAVAAATKVLMERMNNGPAE